MWKSEDHACAFRNMGELAAGLAASLPGIMDRAVEAMRPTCDPEKWKLCISHYEEIVDKGGLVNVYASLYDTLAMMTLTGLRAGLFKLDESDRQAWQAFMNTGGNLS